MLEEHAATLSLLFDVMGADSIRSEDRPLPISDKDRVRQQFPDSCVSHMRHGTDRKRSRGVAWLKYSCDQTLSYMGQS